MKYVSNLTDRNRRSLAALPAGFPIEMKVLGPSNPGPWESATVVGYTDEGRDGEGDLTLQMTWDPTGELFTFGLYESTEYSGRPHLSYGSGAELVSVRWSPEALALFVELGGETFAGAVLSVLS